MCFADFNSGLAKFQECPLEGESEDQAEMPHAFFINRAGKKNQVPLASIEAVLFVETMICELPMNNLMQHTDELHLT